MKIDHNSAVEMARICQYDHPCNIDPPPNSWSGHIYFMTKSEPMKNLHDSCEFMALKDGLMGLYTECHVFVTMFNRNV
jgi:hypothetical protein